jgi:hypothetical protein
VDAMRVTSLIFLYVRLFPLSDDDSFEKEKDGMGMKVAVFKVMCGTA